MQNFLQQPNRGDDAGKATHMGGCQNYGPKLDPYYNTAPNIWGTQKGTIILTTTHMFNCKGFVWQSVSLRRCPILYVLSKPGSMGEGNSVAFSVRN